MSSCSPIPSFPFPTTNKYVYTQIYIWMWRTQSCVVWTQCMYISFMRVKCTRMCVCVKYLHVYVVLLSVIVCSCLAPGPSLIMRTDLSSQTFRLWPSRFFIRWKCVDRSEIDFYFQHTERSRRDSTVVSVSFVCVCSFICDK